MITESEATEFKCSPWIGLTNLAQNPDNWVWVHSLKETNNVSYTSWVWDHPYNDNYYNFAIMGYGDDYNWVDMYAEFSTCSICQFFPR